MNELPFRPFMILRPDGERVHVGAPGEHARLMVRCEHPGCGCCFPNACHWCASVLLWGRVWERRDA